MSEPLRELVASYDAAAPLAEAFTIPAGWYVDSDLFDLERRTVFAGWHYAGRLDQVKDAGQYLTANVAGEPILVVRGADGVLRGFFNVCRHHAAEVMTEAHGTAKVLRCPYHGWTYGLDGALKGTPDFGGVACFEREKNGLVPVATEVWETFVFVRLAPNGAPLAGFLGEALVDQFRPLAIEGLHFLQRRHYAFECNWKVFVDNYLDGGYHIPYLHKGLDSVLDYASYRIDNGPHHCLQWSPMVKDGAEEQTGAVRGGERALYYWIYPNFMVNWYEGYMDTNLVIPLAVDRTEVVFDFYFPDVSEGARERNLASLAVGQRIQDEDTAICKSVQRGLTSRAYRAGRLSVRREGGEHLFHRLLAADLTAGLE
ncbi:MAG TPA: aromatic ring-hydroxylating dioxygenase subunit alpha [Thermoanaerobaculia bacterium]|nr:aromatic ring-hydroxylating dioxygenase subunit alpha [Thermoanaerobaculia bacterium]